MLQCNPGSPTHHGPADNCAGQGVQFNTYVLYTYTLPELYFSSFDRITNYILCDVRCAVCEARHITICTHTGAEFWANTTTHSKSHEIKNVQHS